MEVTRLSQIPVAIFAIEFASSGAISAESAHFRNSKQNILQYLREHVKKLTDMQDWIASLPPHGPLVFVFVDNVFKFQFESLTQSQSVFRCRNLEMSYDWWNERFTNLDYHPIFSALLLNFRDQVGNFHDSNTACQQQKKVMFLSWFVTFDGMSPCQRWTFLNKRSNFKFQNLKNTSGTSGTSGSTLCMESSLSSTIRSRFRSFSSDDVDMVWKQVNKLKFEGMENYK